MWFSAVEWQHIEYFECVWYCVCDPHKSKSSPHYHTSQMRTEEEQRLTDDQQWLNVERWEIPSPTNEGFDKIILNHKWG